MFMIIWNQFANIHEVSHLERVASLSIIGTASIVDLKLSLFSQELTLQL